MKELVSVIVPIYKVEDDLQDCIDSITDQTYENLEIILVDDGSPDKCGVIADKAASKDTRITVIHKENGGLSDARNAGLSIFTGDYVTFVDSDDLLECEFIDEMMHLAKKFQADVVVCDNSVFKKNGSFRKLITLKEPIERCFSREDGVSSMLYQRYFDVAAWGKLYHRKVFDDVRYPKGLIHEDIPTTYKTMLKSERIVHTTKRLYRYQIRDNSIENEKFTLRKMDCIKTAQMMLDDIKINYPQYIDAARSRYLAANIHILAQIEKNIPEKKIIKNNIKRVRRNVIFDSFATKRVRIACLISYISFELLTSVLNILNGRKYT